MSAAAGWVAQATSLTRRATCPAKRDEAYDLQTSTGLPMMLLLIPLGW